jgi:hypothetical protein
MKIFKKFVFAVLALFVISSVGGYFYFKTKFKPPENSLKVKGVTGKIPIRWISNESNPNVALLLPVKLEGISQIFYMQLDFGSTTTIFYSKPLNSIQSKFSSFIKAKNDNSTTSLKFDLGQMAISSDKFKIL